MAADSKATGPMVTVDVEKITPICFESDHRGQHYRIPLAIASGAGHAGTIHKFARIAQKHLFTYLRDEWTMCPPSFDQFEDAVADIEQEFMGKLSQWRTNDVQPNVRTLLCGLSPDGEPSMYEFGRDGIACPVHGSPGFSCLGTGFITGGDLILKQFWEPNLNVQSGILLSAYIISTVSLVDPNVGPFEGSSFYFRVVEGTPDFGQLEQTELRKAFTNVELRTKALRITWDLCDNIGERDVVKMLKKKQSEHLVDDTH